MYWYDVINVYCVDVLFKYVLWRSCFSNGICKILKHINILRVFYLSNFDIFSYLTFECFFLRSSCHIIMIFKYTSSTIFHYTSWNGNSFSHVFILFKYLRLFWFIKYGLVYFVGIWFGHNLFVQFDCCIMFFLWMLLVFCIMVI